MAPHKARLRFAKHGDLRLVGHQDLMRCLERMLRRASIPMAYSQGFNPRPRMAFALALGLGIEGRREVVELELSAPMEASELLARLASESPPGLDWLEAEEVGPGRAARVESASYLVGIPAGRREAARSAIASLLESERLVHRRRKADRTVEFDLRPFVLGADLGADGLLRFRLKMAQDGSARPEDVLDVLGLGDLTGEGAILVRADLELAPTITPQSGPPGRPRPDPPPPDDDPGPSGEVGEGQGDPLTDQCPP